MSLVERLRRSGREVVIVGPIPELETSAPEALARKQLYGETSSIGPAYGEFLAREAAVLPVLQTLSQQSGVTVVYPSQYLCDAQQCEVEKQGRSLYMDDNHLSDAGLIEIRPLLEDVLAQAPPTAGDASGDGPSKQGARNAAAD